MSRLSRYDAPPRASGVMSAAVTRRSTGDRAGKPARDPDNTGRRGVWPLLVAAILFIVVAWGLAAAISGLSAYRNLTDARTHAAAAQDHLRAARLAEARDRVSEAVTAATASSVELHRPWVVPLRWVPGLGANLRVVTTLSDGARDVGVEAAAFLSVAQTIVTDERNQQVGEISLTYLSELAPPARNLADTLARVTSEVEQLDSGWLLGPVAQARDDYLDLVADNLEQVVLASDLLTALPSFLGESEPRTYLVAAAALSEIRGSGGLLGSWTLLTADEGHLRFDGFVDVDDLPQPPGPVEAPSEGFAARYGDRDALRQYRNANLTPDFPSAAQVLLRLWEMGGGQPVDGVIMADPVAFQQLAERTGGLEVPGYGTLAAADTLRFVGLDAYDHFEDAERKQALGATATAAFMQMLAVLDDADVPATVEMLWSLAQGGHFRIYTTDPALQPVFETAGVAGELPDTAGESAGVFVNNLGGNKVDWFEERAISHEVELHPDGTTRSTVEVVFDNQAPTDGHRRGVLGPWTELTEAGDALSLVTFTCSTTCEIVEAAAGSQDGGTELGRPMNDTTVLVPAGASRTLRYETITQDAWWVEDGQLIVDVEHLVQPTLHGVDLQVRVKVPDASTVRAAPEEAEASDGHVVVSERASGRVRHRFVFEPDP